ncbi:arrestin domain-containing protein 4 [Pituophis catenifer annectens]|uniref:arrestin domain-containing protein 4 n=1 Tax=Pituophis catenifer annectens TaxID=94852 RepID=UPI003995B582
MAGRGWPLLPLPPVKALSVALSEASGGAQGYRGGQEVSGQVSLEVAAPLRLRALRLEACGGARAAWTEAPPMQPPPPPPPPQATGTRLEAEVPYLEARRELLLAGDEGFILLEAGKYEFPFSFQLPLHPLATSFAGKYGSIQYFVNVTLESASGPHQTVSREFQVISHIDVNSPLLLSPVRQTQDKMVGCWFFTSGPVCLSAKIDRKGFCNGEVIPIYAEIENCSSRLIVPKAAIFQIQTYVVRGKTKTFRQMVANVRGNHIASGSTDTWNGKTLKIPPVTPSILDCCIIRVEYSLAVYVHIPGAKKLMVELPLVIGTIPCTAFSSRNSSFINQLAMDMRWLAQSLPDHPEAPPNYADIVSEEEYARHVTVYPTSVDCDEQLRCPMLAYIQEFRFQPPPLYSEIDPYPTEVEDNRLVSLVD